MAENAKRLNPGDHELLANISSREELSYRDLEKALDDEDDLAARPRRAHRSAALPQLCLNASNTPASDKIHHGEQVTSDNPAVQGRRLGGREPSGGSEIRGEGRPGGGEKVSRE